MAYCRLGVRSLGVRSLGVPSPWRSVTWRSVAPSPNLDPRDNNCKLASFREKLMKAESVSGEMETGSVDGEIESSYDVVQADDT